MTKTKRRVVGRLITCMLSCLLPLSAADGPGDVAGAPAAPASSSQIEELKQLLLEQQRQIDELRRELAQQSARIDSNTGNRDAKQAEAKQIVPAPSYTGASQSDGTQFPTTGQVASTTAMVPAVPLSSTVPLTNLSALPQVSATPATEPLPTPLQIRIGDATITPVGFMDITNTWRSTNAGTSLQTNFGNFPYNNTVPGRMTEDKWSAENSRLGLRVDANVRGANVLGYFEGDFVGGVAGNNTQVSSNSMLFRIRQYYVDVRKGFWEILGGQAWSMIVPNRKGMSPLPADLFYSQVVDVNYTNGLFWGRIPGVRFIGHPSEKVTFGIALENSTQYFGGSGGGGIPTLPAALTTTYSTQLDNSVNNDRTTPNLHPDIIAKIVLEPSSRFHFEVGGIESTVKTFNPSTNTYFTKAGGAGTVAINAELVKNFRLVTNNFYGSGEGRYLFGAAPDFIIRADGSPSMVRAASTVSGFEATVKNIAAYAYYGGVYVGRNTALDANGTSPIGYGFTGSANSQNRSIQELTVGWTHTIWRDPRYGALQYMAQYAYFFRNPWYVAPNNPKNAHESAIWFNLRYVLPGSAPTVKY